MQITAITLTGAYLSQLKKQRPTLRKLDLSCKSCSRRHALTHGLPFSKNSSCGNCFTVSDPANMLRHNWKKLFCSAIETQCGCLSSLKRRHAQNAYLAVQGEEKSSIFKKLVYISPHLKEALDSAHLTTFAPQWDLGSLCNTRY